MSKSPAKKSAKSAKSTKVVKSAKSAPVAKSAKKAAKKTPSPMMEKLIALMLRKDGAGISDFQQVEGFNLPSMAVVKAARRAGYEASASKKPGERTRYVARRV